MPTSSPTTFAPRSVRRRKIENGISGLLRARLDEDERAPAARSRAAAGVSVWVEPQPACSASTSAYTRIARPGGHRHRAGHVERGGGVVARSRPAGEAPAARPPARSARSPNSTHSQPRPSVSMPPSSTPAAPPDAGHGAPDPERLVALGALGEGGGHDRQRRRGDQRRAHALDGAGGDQRAARSGRARPRARPPRTAPRPTMKIRRRPSRSARRPPSSRKPPKVSV